MTSKSLETELQELAAITADTLIAYPNKDRDRALLQSDLFFEIMDEGDNIICDDFKTTGLPHKVNKGEGYFIYEVDSREYIYFLAQVKIALESKLSKTESKLYVPTKWQIMTIE